MAASGGNGSNGSNGSHGSASGGGGGSDRRGTGTARLPKAGFTDAMESGDAAVCALLALCLGDTSPSAMNAAFHNVA